MKRNMMASLFMATALVSSSAMALNPHIRELDLSIEGVDDNKEFVEPAPETTPKGPGGFVCLNGWKKIKLKAVGVNPPMKTRLNWNSSKIEVWTAKSGGTQVDNETQWDPASDMPTELWVKGIEVSSTGPTKDASGIWLTCGLENLCLEAINNGSEPTTIPGTYYDRIAFTVIDVRQHEINANRVSAPVEDPFPVKAEEHFEIRGNFKFKLDPEITFAPSCIRYEVWDTDGLDDLITSGVGAEFTYAWQYGVDEGDVFVRFYCDQNGNGEYGSGESKKETPEFWVQARKWYDFSVQYSDQIGDASDSIQSVFNHAENLVIRKDSAADYRACVSFNAASISRFVSGTARPDPVIWDVWYNAAGDLSDCGLHCPLTDVTFVHELTGAAGCCWGNNWHDIVIDWDWRDLNTLAHEIGHGVGIAGDYRDPPLSDIMYWQLQVPQGTELRKDDADKYD